MHNRTPRTMAEAFGHHSNNTLWDPRARPVRKRLWVWGLLTALLAATATAALVALFR